MTGQSTVPAPSINDRAQTVILQPRDTLSFSALSPQHSCGCKHRGRSEQGGSQEDSLGFSKSETEEVSSGEGLGRALRLSTWESPDLFDRK